MTSGSGAEDVEPSMLAREAARRSALLSAVRGNQRESRMWLSLAGTALVFGWFLFAAQQQIHQMMFIQMMIIALVGLVGSVLIQDRMMGAKLSRIERRVDALIQLLEEQGLLR